MSHEQNQTFRIRPLEPDDADALHALTLANREHLAPWDPHRPEYFFTRDGRQEHLSAQLARHRTGHEYPYVMTLGGRLVGQITLSNVVRGPLQSANVGYWIDREHQGRGLTSQALRSIVDLARDDFGLHRLEAGTMLENVASQRVLTSCGFEEYGVAPKFLKIAGSWQDHRLYQRILHD
ncbi:GNAT family N-acetyltransferase [Nocardioides sp. Iso805N]|uniref:GNAT family N-acetyltransferase n=1 Tax=Nocardioides sp. Iso805N TaxID=1283287 RepID=UPI0003772CB5|nr:GNAT family protein [Nocardioides sp. Iso805N]